MRLHCLHLGIFQVRFCCFFPPAKPIRPGIPPLDFGSRHSNRSYLSRGCWAACEGDFWLLGWVPPLLRGEGRCVAGQGKAKIPGMRRAGQDGRTFFVLDICASWVPHVISKELNHLEPS